MICYFFFFLDFECVVYELRIRADSIPLRNRAAVLQKHFSDVPTEFSLRYALKTSRSEGILFVRNFINQALPAFPI